ncbi:MAG: RDD family protein, partial [Acidimicrobiales bacterium]
ALVGLVVAVVYSGLLDGSSHGQTVGKMAMRLQVRDATVGGPIGFRRAAVRRFIYQCLFLALAIPGVVNALSPLWDRHRQAWHDKAVGSVLVNAAPPPDRERVPRR